MPTMVEMEVDASADPAENGVLHRFDYSESSQEIGRSLNDSTRLVDDTVIRNEAPFFTQQDGGNTFDYDETRVDDDDTSTSVDNDETRLGNDSIMSHDEPVFETNGGSQMDQIPCSQVCQLESKELEAFVRKVGPQEQQYRRRHERYVSRVISDVQHRHPRKLRVFSDLSTTQQEEERERIVILLHRLGIASNATLHCSSRYNSQSQAPLAAESSAESSTTRLDPDQSSATSNSPHQNSFQSCPPVDDASASLRPGVEEEDEPISDQSKALFSPESDVVDELASRMDQSMGLMAPGSNSSTPSRDSETPPPADSSASSVELVRKTNRAPSSPTQHMYESPMIAASGSKRLASASGKRGTDLLRRRTSDDSFVSLDAGVDNASEEIPSPSQLRCSSVNSPGSPFFCTSQSPICGHSQSWDEQSVESKASHYSTDSDNLSPNDTLNSVDCTMNDRRKLRDWQESSLLQEIPANVRLRDGVPFRIKPLRVGHPSRRHGGKSGRQRRVSLAPMPDPLGRYEGTLRKKMKAAYAWMKDKDSCMDDEDMAGGILFSMRGRQIMDITLKVIMNGDSDHAPEDEKDDAVNGTTLIVARNKEDLDYWQSALREGTTCSVLNHATMAPAERKRTSTANRCAGYDVVLTTYDALKSKDIAVPLDGEGHVIFDKIGFQDGWYSSRSSGSEAPDRMEQLSVLHQISWRRIIFVDALGRKSYVAKPDTARSVAAVALSGSSRFIFFPKLDNDKVRAVDALGKSDRKAFKTVSSVLHFSHEQAQAGLLSDAMFDMNHVSIKSRRK